MKCSCMLACNAARMGDTFRVGFVFCTLQDSVSELWTSAPAGILTIEICVRSTGRLLAAKQHFAQKVTGVYQSSLTHFKGHSLARPATCGDYWIS